MSIVSKFSANNRMILAVTNMLNRFAFEKTSFQAPKANFREQIDNPTPSSFVVCIETVEFTVKIRQRFDFEEKGVII
jgi:hypothetical protein